MRTSLPTVGTERRFALKIRAIGRPCDSSTGTDHSTGTSYCRPLVKVVHKGVGVIRIAPRSTILPNPSTNRSLSKETNTLELIKI
jgi:hypothetical protein